MDNVKGKVYCIDPDNSMVANGLSALFRRSRILIDFLILHLITIVTQLIIVGVLEGRFPFIGVLYVFSVCCTFCLLDFILCVSWVIKYASKRYIPFVVVDSDTITFIKLISFKNSKKIQTYGLHKAYYGSDDDHQSYVHEPVPFFTIYDYPADEILDKITHGYVLFTYRNVKFSEETAYHYHFTGDLEKVRGRKKRASFSPDKKFKIAKIYENHKTLGR